MSFVIIPSDIYNQQSAAPSIRRCGPSFTALQNTSTAIPRGLLSALFDDNDEDILFNEAAPSLTPWQELHLEQLRRQEYLQEVERHRRRILAEKQQQAELERRQEQARREKAARLAWHQEQQRKAALALEYRRRLEAHKKRQQEEEYAHQVRLAQQARAAHQAQQKQIDWEQVAAQSLFGVIDLVQHLFREEEPQSTSKVDGKKREKTTEETNQGDVNVEKDYTTEQAKVEQSVSQPASAGTKGVTQEQSTQASTDLAAAQPEHIQTQEEEAMIDVQEEKVQSQAQEDEPEEGRLVFTYPLPQDEASRFKVKAEDIGVSYDKDSHTIQLTGLWPTEKASGSSSSSQEESRGRSRSRSPKRSRVSDVDEKTGEEIVKNDDNIDGFVEVPKVQTTTTKLIRLPPHATVAHLRAELTDDGFKVFI